MFSIFAQLKRMRRVCGSIAPLYIPERVGGTRPRREDRCAADSQETVTGGLGRGPEAFKSEAKKSCGHKRSLVAAVVLTVFGGAAPAQAGDTYACYYNPEAPCYLAQGHFGSNRDTSPVSYTFGIGGDGTYSYANNDRGGTVYASAAGGNTSGGYTANAQLTHFIDVDPISGLLDEFVPLRIQASPFQLITGDGGGYATYTATQQGRSLVSKYSYASKISDDSLFYINEIVYVRPSVPISIYMLANAGVGAFSGDSSSVTVDPIYEIVGEYASRYRLSGLLSSDTSASPVPEPETWSMMILGLAAIGFILRRRLVQTPAVGLS